MKSITELALKKYPPKGMNDAQDWQHDENAELRKAYIQGVADMSYELLQMLDPNFNIIVEKLNATVVKNQEDIISAINTNYIKLKQISNYGKIKNYRAI